MNIGREPSCGCGFRRCCEPYPQPCPHPPHPPHPYPPYVPFRSSYIEAVGSAQRVENGGLVVFDVDPDSLDVAGYGIELDETGTVFTIGRPGLYQIEWSMNAIGEEQPMVVCLMEQGSPSSSISNEALSGNLSSGALLNIGSDEVPFTISLHNYGAPINLKEPTSLQNTAVSLRIIRFADGESLVGDR